MIYSKHNRMYNLLLKYFYFFVFFVIEAVVLDLHILLALPLAPQKELGPSTMTRLEDRWGTGLGTQSGGERRVTSVSHIGKDGGQAWVCTLYTPLILWSNMACQAGPYC